MSVITVLKNQKANKIKKYHMKSILNEVKNKTSKWIRIAF